MLEIAKEESNNAILLFFVVFIMTGRIGNKEFRFVY